MRGIEFGPWAVVCYQEIVQGLGRWGGQYSIALHHAGVTFPIFATNELVTLLLS